jgi:hypothetical protein
MNVHLDQIITLVAEELMRVLGFVVRAKVEQIKELTRLSALKEVK